MKNILVIIALLILPVAGFAQSETTIAVTNTELIDVKKVEAVTPVRVKAARKAKHIRVNYKKSSDIISIKAYRKSLNVKVSTKKLMC
jgi:hypothetical protein